MVGDLRDGSNLGGVVIFTDGTATPAVSSSAIKAGASRAEDTPGIVPDSEAGAMTAASSDGEIASVGAACVREGWAVVALSTSLSILPITSQL